MSVSLRFLSNNFCSPRSVKWGTFFVVTNALIAIHEAGHYFACKKYDRKVTQFQVGYPGLVSFENSKNEEIVLGAFPLGGGVSFQEVEATTHKQKSSRKKENIEIFLMGPCCGSIASLALLILSQKLPFNAMAKGLRLASVVGIETNIFNVVPNPYLPTDGGEIYRLLKLSDN